MPARLAALAAGLVAATALAAAPVRVASGVSGHIHPALCVTKAGTVLGIFSQSDMRDLRVTRSADGGKTWSEPTPFGPTKDAKIYPGSLTALKDGRVVHAWNVWYPHEKAKNKESRYVAFAVSADDGKTWGETKTLPKNPSGEHSVIRHPLAELSDTEWLFPLADRTVVYNPKTGESSPFGDGQNHGLVPVVRTPAGTIVSGSGQRSTDGGKTWAKVSPFPAVGANGWRFDLTCLPNGWLVASEVQGAGFGGDRWRWVVSRDDGKSWDFDHAVTFYEPGRPIGGRACPKTVQLDAATVGTLFYDIDKAQPGGPGVFFLRTPLAALAAK